MKYKKIPKDYIKICVDRLTRFKPVAEKYERVFRDILNKFLISKPEDNLNLNEMATEIFNSSVPFEYDPFISNVLLKEESRAFNLDESQLNFLNSGLNIGGALKYIANEERLPLNVKRLISLQNERLEPEILRQRYGFLYPVKKVVLTEGATEEILLSKFAKECGYDFNRKGVYVLGAGGKNQVARKYYKMIEDIKLPIFILLDYDALETKEVILTKLRKRDKIHLIKKGEFEDILSLNLITEAINFNFSNNLHCSANDFNPELKMTKNLHILFKNKGFGEYKKADFAKMVKNYLETPHKNFKDEITSEIKEIVEEIKNL